MDKTPILIHPGEVARTAGDGIDEEALRNKEISVKLRELNNLIQLNADNELYVDLQLPSGIKPTDDFPVGVTTGRILQADGWQQSGTIINSKTTSGDYVRLIYANDGNLYYDPGTGDWIMIGNAVALDVNTKTFFITGTTGADNIASAQEAIDWYREGKNPLIMYNNRCYILAGIADNGIEGAFFTFESAWNNSSAVNGNQTVIIETAPGQSNPYVVASIGTGVKENHNARTQTFYVRSGTGAGAINDATSVLRWYKRFNIYNYGPENIFNPIILSADANGSGQYTYHLTGVDTGVLMFTSLILTDEAPQDYFLERIQINYSGNNVTSLQRNEYWIGQYKAGSGIVIDGNTHTISANIQGALVYKGNVATTADLPSSGNTVGDVYYVEADGLMYAWDGTAWKAVGNTQIDLSNYFNMTTNDSDDITAGTTNLFVTQSQINAWSANTTDIATINNTITNIQGDILTLQGDVGDLQTALNGKQDTLVSGTNIKTINGESILGSGDIDLSSIITSGASMGALINACKSNGSRHETSYDNDSVSQYMERTETYTFQGMGWVWINGFHGASAVARVRINGESVLYENNGSGTYTTKYWVGPFTMGPGDTVEFYTGRGGSSASMKATVVDYY